MKNILIIYLNVRAHTHTTPIAHCNRLKKKKRKRKLKSALFFKNSAIKLHYQLVPVESVIRKGTVVARAHMKKSSTTP